jgi:hypothetical protein
VLKVGSISLDGTKLHADASRHNAIRDIRLRELETQLRAGLEELFVLSEQNDQRGIPDGLVVREEMARREDRLARLAKAKSVLEARAVDQGSLLIVANALSNHPNDCQEAEPTLSAMPSTIGTPEAAAFAAGYLALRRWPLVVRNAASSRTSRLSVITIILAGSSGSRRCPIRPPRTRAPWSRWPTSSSASLSYPERNEDATAGVPPARSRSPTVFCRRPRSIESLPPVSVRTHALTGRLS